MESRNVTINQIQEPERTERDDRELQESELHEVSGSGIKVPD